MFRLAALYEERAREKTEGDIAPGLEPAIALYKRIIREFPKYDEIAAVHYYLGHALTDSGRIDEGQQAWRVARLPEPLPDRRTIPRTPRKLLLEPLPQDHDAKFWDDWKNRHPIPLDQDRTLGRAHEDATAQGAASPIRAATSSRSSIPTTDCTPIPQDTLPGEEPRYVAEVWWQIGNYHFDQIDPRGGPYNLNRAVSAYQHSMKYKKPPIYGVAMYKLAWTYFKQQRYTTAVDEFVKLLHYTDEQEAKTGDPGADFRSEAYTYIAGSLTYVDFEGPPPEDPYIPRNDVLDTEPDPLVAEQKMAIAHRARAGSEARSRRTRSGRSRSTRRSRRSSSRSRRTATRSRCSSSCSRSGR